MRYLARDLADRLGMTHSAPTAIATHLREAAAWIGRAQDGTPDDGVAHSYDLRKARWIASYPETTGYIIPTLYDYAQLYGADAYRERALRMARWEVAELLPDGGVRAGTMAAEVVAPTIFNTGQVLFGFARAARESQEPLIAQALQRAADWLVAAQDDDGCWRRFPSPFTTTKTAAYNVRCAFGLVRAHQVTGCAAHLSAAVRNAEWVMTTVRGNDWLPGNCLTHNDDDSALTHTLAYSIRGLLEVGAAVDRSAFVEQAVKMARHLRAVQRADGSLPAYLLPDWQPRCSWSCVTGNAQMALNWLRLAQISGEPGFRDAAARANRFNMSLQRLDGAPEYRGAMPGSFPISGGYMTWRFPNWATKFFMDALMLEEHFDRTEEVG